jgi:hypothetical protein
MSEDVCPKDLQVPSEGAIITRGFGIAQDSSAAALVADLPTFQIQSFPTCLGPTWIVDDMLEYELEWLEDSA